MRISIYGIQLREDVSGLWFEGKTPGEGRHGEVLRNTLVKSGEALPPVSI